MASVASPTSGKKTSDFASKSGDRSHRNPVIETAVATATPVVRGRALKTGWACLLLAEDRNRRDGLARSAEAGGWEPIVCGSVGEAIRQHKRWATQLAAIDLGLMSEMQKTAYMKFAGTLASRERLLVISDEPTNSDGELLARQAGAWVYLPTPDFHKGVVELFAEARAAAEKLGATLAG